MKVKPLHRWSSFAITTFAAVAAFSTYFSMYAFRKPFTAAEYTDAADVGIGVDFKIAVLIAQVLGYALSKFIGIKVIAELKATYRFQLLLGLAALAWLALLGFAYAQGSSWAMLWLFLNGLPLGLVWGIVFSYLEGRQTTEVLGAVLCSSFIVSSGVVKSVGVWLVQSQGLDVYWMPFVTGGIFMPLLLLGSYCLELVPPPSQADIAQRTIRLPMQKTDRRAFFRRYAPGLVALIICYVFITIYRDFRDSFAVELWTGLGYGDTPSVYTLAELPIAVLTLLMLALTMYIRSNRTAFMLYLFIIFGGSLLIAGSTLAFQAQLLGGAAWMVLVGAGLYIIYIPFNAILFERLIAALGSVANVGFLIYLADASGYAGSVMTLLYKNFGQPNLSWLSFFTSLSYGVATLSALATLWAIQYFRRKIPIPSSS